MKTKQIIAFAVVCGIVILVGIVLAGGIELKGLKAANPSGEQVVFNNVMQNVASVSFDAGDDTIIYESTPNSTLSVGDRVMFKTGGDIEPLTVGFNYFVVTASVSDRFEVASTSGGTALDLTASTSGGENFQEIPVGTVLDVSQSLYHIVSIYSEDAASASVQIVGSTADQRPDFLSPRSLTNRWDYIDTNDAQNATEAEGDSTIDLTSDDYRMFQVYPTGLKWIGVIFNDLASGSFDIRINSTD